MQRENVKHITAAAVVDTVLQFCWEFKENPCLFGQNARQEWSATWQIYKSWSLSIFNPRRHWDRSDTV